MVKINPFYTLIVLVALMFSACEKDPEPPNEEEVITTLNYILTPTGGGDDVTLSFVDLDGDGGNDATITGGTLAANQTYSGRLDLLNEAETPTESITDEIAEEDDEHQFFFQTTVSGLVVSYTDMDANGNPIGLATSLTTGDAASGNLVVILKHEPVKDAEGVSGGDITNAAGETDIEVTFQINVE